MPQTKCGPLPKVVEGDHFWQTKCGPGGPLLAAKTSPGGPVLAAIHGPPWGHLLAGGDQFWLPKVVPIGPGLGGTCFRMTSPRPLIQYLTKIYENFLSSKIC